MQGRRGLGLERLRRAGRAAGRRLGVSVRAIDAAGNADASPATIKLGEAPDGTEPTGAAAFASAAAGLVFTASRGATLSCRLDGGAWKECASPLAVDGLGWGRHAFARAGELRQRDGARVARTRAWTAAAPAPRIAALQFPVLLKRGRDGRARANGRKPALRFALNVQAGVRLSIARMRGASAASTLGSWSVSVEPGDAVVPVPDKVVRRLKRGRYRLVARAAGARDVARLRRRLNIWGWSPSPSPTCSSSPPAARSARRG